MSRRADPARDRALVEAYNSGVPLGRIAAEYGLKVESVRVTAARAAKRSGVVARRPKRERALVAVPVAPRWFERPSPGRMRSAVDRALAGSGSVESAPVPAELARDLADLVDSARERQDPKLWLAASARLEALLSRMLGSGPTPAPVDPRSDPIGDALGSGPE